MIKDVYLDHAAASFPLAPGAEDAMEKCRSLPREPQLLDAAVQELQQRLCRLLNAPSPQTVQLVPEPVHPLFCLLQRILSSEDKVLTLPGYRDELLRYRKPQQVEEIPLGRDGLPALEQLSPILSQAKAVIVPHADFQTGALQPIAALGRLCRKAGCLLLVDAAQSIGRVSIDMAALDVDALSFSSCNGLLGPRGIHILVTGDTLTPVLAASTAFPSSPSFDPPALYGFLAALTYFESHAAILMERQRRLGGHLWARMKEYDGEGLSVPGPGPLDRVGIVSVDFSRQDNERAALLLKQRYHVHASVFQGMVRFSAGPFLSFEDIDYVQGAVGTLASEE